MAGSSNYVKFDLTKEQAKLWAKLTRLQKSFIREYISGNSGSDAIKKSDCKAVGISSITSSAYNYLTNIDVKAFLDSIKPNLEAMAEDKLNDSIMSRE